MTAFIVRATSPEGSVFYVGPCEPLLVHDRGRAVHFPTRATAEARCTWARRPGWSFEVEG